MRYFNFKESKMPAIASNLIGNTYGRLTVLSRCGSMHNKSLWLCQCKCGNTTKVISTSLTRTAVGRRANGTKSCGHCKDAEKYPKEYNAWCDMISRCKSPTHESYSYYGGRGITICNRWYSEFFNFLEDMGKAPINCSLDRINNDGDYEPSNCRWTTWSVQMINRRFHNQHDH